MQIYKNIPIGIFLENVFLGNQQPIKADYCGVMHLIWACAAMAIPKHHQHRERHRALRCNKLFTSSRKPNRLFHWYIGKFAHWYISLFSLQSLTRVKEILNMSRYAFEFIIHILLWFLVCPTRRIGGAEFVNECGEVEDNIYELNRRNLGIKRNLY